MAELLRPGERTGPEGKPVANRVLLSLSDHEFRALRPKLKYTQFKTHDILHESQRKVENIYFPDHGLISLVIVMTDGKTAEAGLMGNEGIVGLEGLMGMKRGPLREIAQIGGDGHYIASAELAKIINKLSDLLLRFSRFAIVNRMQISQTAACNRLHDVEKRLARWLLLSQDRVDSGFLPITHDFLATMLGTDRSSVTEAAGALQRKKIIQYARGSVQILNRKALEQSSCECYELIRDYNGELTA